MSTTTATTTTVRNGVPVDKLFGTIGKVKEQPELAAFRFTARNRRVEGTASRSSIHEWAGARGEHLHVEEFSMSVDHPTLGHGHGPTPQEYALHALAACVTAGIATTAAARKIDLTSIESTARGEIDVRGALGIDPEVRNGYQRVLMDVTVDGDASASELEALVESGKARSAVHDMLSATTPVEVRSA